MLLELEKETFNFSNLELDEIKKKLSKYNLSLTPDEALKIQNEILKRPPTLSELVLWSIQGSEHCSYKSTRNHIKKMVTDGPNVILGAKEDAGVITIAQDVQKNKYGLVISHESHNHPSQIVPYEGAATGIGGNVRDVCCMGAEVVALADGLRFGDINKQKTKWLQDGVVSGIAGYGNPIGVPNLAGDLYFDPGYNDNCLVTVVTLGIVPEKQIIHSYAPKNAENHVYILVGKPTDMSGFGGASFASEDLSEEKTEKNKGAVQEPNAFLKRHLLKANYALFEILKEKNLIDEVGFKDLGAGGVACASVEMAESQGLGAEIEVDKIPVSVPKLNPSVILCSETQERFMWLVPENLVDLVLEHYNKAYALPAISFGATAKVVGKIRQDGMYVVRHNGEVIVHAKASDITKGIVYDRPTKSYTKDLKEPANIKIENHNNLLLKLLAHENIASREVIFEKYDKQVQGRTAIERDQATAGVIRPFNETKYPKEIRSTGVALAVSQNPRYNKIDSYWGAINAVIEAAMKVAAVGASPQAITDCLCFGNPEKPEQMWDFTESVRGVIDACKAVGLKEHKDASLPIVAGNVSLYNESKNGAIPPSPMISCVGIMPNASKAISKSFQKPNSTIVLVGERQDECGGSVFYSLYDELGANIPKSDLTKVASSLHAVINAIEKDFVLSCNTISTGGAAVALSEMAFNNEIGFKVEVPGGKNKLFTETFGFVLEVPNDNLKDLEQIFANYKVKISNIGNTVKEQTIVIDDLINLSLVDAKNSYTNGLREKLA